MRAAFAFLPALVTLIAMTAITPAFAAGVDQNRLDRTVLPEHFNALPFSPWPLDPVPPFHRTPIRPERVVYQLKGSIRQVAKVDRDLSTACRRGTFIQRMNFIFRVRSADDRPYGIGWGSGVNLHDPEKRGNADKVYLFDRQDTGLCAVWMAPLATLQRFLAPVPLRDRP
jgi:hypothetical protein